MIHLSLDTEKVDAEIIIWSENNFTAGNFHMWTFQILPSSDQYEGITRIIDKCSACGVNKSLEAEISQDITREEKVTANQCKVILTYHITGECAKTVLRGWDLKSLT